MSPCLCVYVPLCFSDSFCYYGILPSFSFSFSFFHFEKLTALIPILSSRLFPFFFVLPESLQQPIAVVKAVAATAAATAPEEGFLFCTLLLSSPPFLPLSFLPPLPLGQRTVADYCEPSDVFRFLLLFSFVFFPCRALLLYLSRGLLFTVFIS